MTVGRGREEAGEREMLRWPSLGCLLLCKALMRFLSLSHVGCHLQFYLGKKRGGSAHGTEV